MTTIYLDDFLVTPPYDRPTIICATRTALTRALHWLVTEHTDPHFSLYYHDRLIDVDVNQSVDDILREHSLQPSGSLEILDQLQDLLHFRELGIRGEFYEGFAHYDRVDDRCALGLLHTLRWILCRLLVVQPFSSWATTTTQQPPESSMEIFVHGGGPTATALLGSVAAYLQSQPEHTLQHIAGASMGAVLAAFVYIHAREPETLFSRFAQTITDTLDGSETLHVDSLRKCIRGLLHEHAQMPLGEFQPHTSTTFDIVAYDVQSGAPVVFNRERTPHIRVEDALIASCGIPGIIGMSKPFEDDRWVADGDVCSLEYLRTRPASTRVFSIRSRVDVDAMTWEIPSPFSIVASLLRAIWEELDAKWSVSRSNPLCVCVEPNEQIDLSRLPIPLGTAAFHIRNIQFGFDAIML